MALASQSSRSGSRRAYMSSRRKRRRRWWPFVLLLLAALACWWFWPRSTDETPVEVPTETRTETPIAPEIVLEPIEDDSPETTPENTQAPSPARSESSRRERNVSTNAGGPSKPADPEPRPGYVSPSAVQALTEAARRSMDDDPVAARRSLSQAWIAGLDGEHREVAGPLSRRLARRTLLEEPGLPGSPWVRARRVAPGESMSGIRQKEGVRVSSGFLARINGLESPDRIDAGQVLWIPEGTFHAQVDLSSRDLAIFQEIAGSRDLLMVVPVGIGRDGRTPVGLFRIKPGSRSRNPSWISPDGRRYAGEDPDNPLGGWWLGLESLEESERDDPGFRGLGLQGTVDPDSVGTACTNGSIRLLSDDAALLYELLDAGSTIDIRR